LILFVILVIILSFTLHNSCQTTSTVTVTKGFVILCYQYAKCCRCLQIVSQHVPFYLQQFPSYSNRKCKKSPFSRTAAHIFDSPRDAPAIIAQYVAWMERQFNACQIPRSMYPSIFNSFRVIRCLSQCVSPKIAICTTILFPLGTPLWQSR